MEVNATDDIKGVNKKWTSFRQEDLPSQPSHQNKSSHDEENAQTTDGDWTNPPKRGIGSGIYQQDDVHPETEKLVPEVVSMIGEVIDILIMKVMKTMKPINIMALNALR